MMERVSGAEERTDPEGAGRPVPEAERSDSEAGAAPSQAEAAGGPGEAPAGPGPASEITFEEIRERAYDLWERNHRPEGLEIQFWLVAERELRAERERRLAGRDEESGGGG